MTKYQEIAHLLRHQLQRGEYPSGKLPPLRKLAADMGVSYLTARQAVKTVQEAGWHEIKAARPLVAVVTPLWSFTDWYRAIRDETQNLGGQVRFFAYASETDPIISNTITQEDYDVIFLYLPDREDSRLLELISKYKERTVVMFRDLTKHGIRCMDGVDPVGIELFLDLLKERGVRRIDVLGRDIDLYSGASDRRQVWQNWIERNGFEGRFFPVPHQSFQMDEIAAVEYCRKYLKKGEFGEALFCLTTPLADGFYRAAYEAGVVPGRDISVFCFGDNQKCALMTPALATVLNVDIPGLVRKVIREYCPGAVRSDQLMFRMGKSDISLGESLIPTKEKRK